MLVSDGTDSYITELDINSEPTSAPNNRVRVQIGNARVAVAVVVVPVRE